MIAQLPPIPVALPLAIAGILLALSSALPRYVPDIVAILTAVAVSGVCALMAAHVADNPLTYWFGGWTPRNGQVIGIDFVVDQAGAAVGCFIGLLFVATLVFAWGYYDEVHAHFHVLMLLFMAGMTGFCLTHDIFNMFVWFEVMSVAAFAVTAYALRSASIAGALNFTVVNTIGSYLILGGIGLIYAQAGALDFSALNRAVAAAPGNPVIVAAFSLMCMGFLIKGAQVPFQSWLADAHAVAPSPVSVIFSGVMVGLGIFGIARLVFDVFAPAPSVMQVVRTLLLGIGLFSTVLGGVMTLIQRHIKRLLAFSTISHIGVMLVGLALLNRAGVAGMLAYFVGHGLVKGSLFMVAGIIESRCGGIDEIGLRGAGRDIWPVGIVMAVGALLLAGLPIGLMEYGSAVISEGAKAVEKAWIEGMILFGAGCTGAAVLRVAGRVFLGFGQVPGEEDRSPTEEEQEKADRPLWVMLLPTIVLLGLALGLGAGAHDFVPHAAGRLMQAAMPQAGLGPIEPEASPWPWLTAALAVALAVYYLGRRALPKWFRRGIDWLTQPATAVLHGIHSGLIGDYVTWIVVGLALFTVAFALA